MFPGSSEYNYKPPLGSVINPNHPISQGLVNCWLFNEQTGNRIYDSNKDNHGNLLNGPIWNSQNNGCLQFDGSNDSIDFGDNFDIGLSNFTFCISFRASSLSGLLHGLFSKAIAADATQRYALFIYNTGGNYKITTFISNGGVSDVQTASVLNAVTNVWYHVVVVYDRSDKVSLYINGNLDSSAIISQFQSVNFQSNYNFRLASYGDASNNASYFFHGLISNFQIYNRALSAEEVRSLYENPYQFINPVSSLDYYSYRKFGILNTPSITSQESMGSAILPGPITISPKTISTTESFSNPINTQKLTDSGQILTSLRFDSSLKITDLNALLKPSISSIQTFGTSGSTIYYYQISAYNEFGETEGSEIKSITTGNSLLDSTNYNRISWNKVKKATGYKIFGRTLDSIKLIANVVNNFYDDKGSALTNILPLLSNTSGYDHKKLNLSEEFILNTGDTYKDNFVAPKVVFDANYGVVWNYLSNVFTVEWSSDITWIFSDFGADTTYGALYLSTYNKKTNIVNQIGLVNLSLPNHSQNQAVWDMKVIYEKVNSGTVSVNGTSVTGSGTDWNDRKLSVGYRIGFGSKDPEFIDTWYEISAINSNTSITLTYSAGVILENTPYVIEEIFILYAKYCGNNNTFGGLFVVKGLSYFDFTNEGQITIPAATTVDRIKACYHYRVSGSPAIVFYPSIAVESFLNNNEQYIYLWNQAINANTFYIYTLNLRANITLTSGITDSAHIASSKPSYSQYVKSGNFRIFDSIKCQHGPGKNKEQLYISQSNRIYRLQSDGYKTNNFNVIFDEYQFHTNIGGGFTGGYPSAKNLQYIPEDDLFFAMDISYAYPLFFKYLNQHNEYLMGKRFFLNPIYTYNSNYMYLKDKNFNNGWLGFDGMISNGSIIYVTSKRRDQYCQMAVLPYKADKNYFAAKYNSYVVTPVISTPKARRLVNIYIDADHWQGTEEISRTVEDYLIYVRTSGIEDNTGKWYLVNRLHDLTIFPATDKCQFRIEFAIFGQNNTATKIYGLHLTYETSDSLPKELSWNLQDSSTTANIIGFKQNDFLKKDYIAFESSPVLMIESSNAITGESIYRQRSFDSTYGQLQYYSNDQWNNGLGQNIKNKRLRFVNTFNFPNNPKLVYTVYNSSWLILNIDCWQNKDQSDSKCLLNYNNITSSSETDNPIVFNGTSFISTSDVIFNRLYSNGITLSIFIKTPSTLSGNSSLISRGNGNQTNNYFNLYLSSDYKVNFWFGNSSVFSSNGSLQPGKKYHICLTFDNTDVKLYVNRKLNKTQAFSVSLSLGTADLKIGNSEFSNTGFTGLIYDVKIYAKSLSSNETLRIYNNLVEKFKSRINGYVRKTLPSSIYYSEGTISFNNQSQNIYIPGLKETIIRFYNQNRNGNFLDSQPFKNREYITSFDIPYSSGSIGFTKNYIGKLVVPTTGSYTFKIQAWTVGYFWLGANALTNFNFTNQNLYSNTGIPTFTTTLNAGEYYDIRLLYSHAGDQRVLFSMSGPGIAETSNLDGYLYSYSANRLLIQGTGTNFKTNCLDATNTLFIGSNNIFDNVQSIVLDKAISQTQFPILTQPYTTFNNLSYAILKNVVVYLDASETKSYPGSGNIWYDISGYDNHFLIINDISHDERGYFTGFSKQNFMQPLSSDIAKVFPFYNLDFTFIFVFKNTTNFYQNSPSGYGYVNFLTYGTNTSYYGNTQHGFNSYYELGNATYIVDDFYQAIWSYSSRWKHDPNKNSVLVISYNNLTNAQITGVGYEKFKIFYNGIKFFMNYRGNALMDTLFGSFTLGRVMFDTKFYSFMALNRAMTDAEIIEITNYFSDKFDFNV